MCGIFGVFALRKASLAYSEGQLIAATTRLSHRGPDHLGHVLTDRAFMSHLRLAIIDLDPRSNQPMLSEDGRWALVFNGEIYNFLELMKELAAAGVNFRTKSDTEVILRAAQVWGIERFLQRANGMFAFALHDRQQNVLHFGRDRLGEKPLFHTVRDDQFIFSSEMSALMALGPQSLSGSGLDAYLTLGFPLPQDHLVAGVRSVPPAHYLRVNLETGEQELRRYWDVRGPQDTPLLNADVDELDAKVRHSIESRMIADVPLCGFLSGGIDSSLIAAIASQRSSLPYRTYCIGYENEDAHNEFEFARLVARQYKLDHHEIRLSISDAKERLLQLVGRLDEPISNWVWLPLDFLSSRARADGYKVAMVGEGADEVFFGYNSMLKSLAELDHAPAAWKHPVLNLISKAVAPFAKTGHKTHDLWRRLGQGPHYMGTSFAFPRTQRPRIAGARLVESGRPASGYQFIADLQSQLRSLGPHDNVDLISYTELYAKMTEVLVRRVDRITMLHGLEARAPFLDHELIEYVFRLTGQKRLVNGEKKGWLRQVALRHIPRECVVRKKQGFSFPFRNWVRQEFRPLVEERFNEGGIFQDQWLRKEFALGLLRKHLSGERDYSPQIWHLYTLALWYDRWFKGQA